MSALRTVKWHFMTFTLLVPSGLAAGPRTSWAPESHTQSWKITFPGKGGITLPWLKYELFWLNPGTDNKMVKGILCSYTKYGRVSTWLLRPPHHHHHRHPIPFTWPQTHCASPLTELLNWLAVKNKSIPLLSSSQFFFFSLFFSFFPSYLAHSHTLSFVSCIRCLGFFLVWEERPQDEIAHGVIALINMFHSLSEGPPSPRPLSCTSSFFFFSSYISLRFLLASLSLRFMSEENTFWKDTYSRSHLLTEANKHMPTHINTHTHTRTSIHSLIRSLTREPEAVRVLDYVACCDLKF